MDVSENLLGLSSSDFLQPPEKFIYRCCEVFGVDLSAEEVAQLAGQLRGGRTRIEAARALIAKRNPLDARAVVDSTSPPVEFRSVTDNDLLKRIAPDDDSAFVTFLFEHFLPGKPPGNDALILTFALKSGSLDREAVMENVLAKARASGANHSHFFYEDELDSLFLSAGVPRLHNDGSSIVLVRHRPGFGWLTAPEIWRQPVDLEQEKWNVSEGWVLCSAKRRLEAGAWRIDIDLIQPREALMLVDVVANVGLDTLAKVMLEGPAKCSLRIDIPPSHQFVELRMFKPRQPEPLNWFKMPNLSFVQRSNSTSTDDTGNRKNTRRGFR